MTVLTFLGSRWVVWWMVEHKKLVGLGVQRPPPPSFHLSKLRPSTRETKFSGRVLVEYQGRTIPSTLYLIQSSMVRDNKPCLPL